MLLYIEGMEPGNECFVAPKTSELILLPLYLTLNSFLMPCEMTERSRSAPSKAKVLGLSILNLK